ncbi:MAG: RepB family plasmid replication initiator protein [Sarcina sp.]
MAKNEKFELKHHKDFHGIQFQDFNVKERNLVFALCYKLMNQESNLLEFDVKEISKISNYTPTKAGDNIYKSLEETYKRIKNASIVVKKENGVKHFVLFTVFETFEDKGLVKIRVNDEYRYLLNQVAKPFTIQDVLEYTSLGSGYSQLMYSLLKEWEKSKNIEFEINKFRELLGIPQGYRISEIDKRVLNPIMEELPQYFFNLKLEKIKTGRKVTSLKFTWGNRIEKIENKNNSDVIDIIEVSDKLNKVIEKVKKNRFIKPLLIIDNIEILVEMFQEKDLIKGLNWSYKEIKQEIKSLNYLIKSIKTGMEQKEKKLVVKTVPEVVQEQEIKEEILKENNLDLEKDQELKITEIEKIKITKDEYEELYKKYLEKQKTNHTPFMRKTFDISNKDKYEIVEKIEIKEEQNLNRIELTQEEFNKIKTGIIFFIKLNKGNYSKELLDEKYKIVEKVELDESVTNLLKLWHISDDEILQGISMGYTRKESIEIIIEDRKQNNIIINFEKITEDKLLGKNNKKLVGGALIARLEKIARDENIKIQYKDKIIG